MQVQISWLLKKPTDLDLHCLQRQDISRINRTRVNVIVIQQSFELCKTVTVSKNSSLNMIKRSLYYLNVLSKQIAFQQMSPPSKKGTLGHVQTAKAQFKLWCSLIRAFADYKQNHWTPQNASLESRCPDEILCMCRMMWLHVLCMFEDTCSLDAAHMTYSQALLA